MNEYQETGQGQVKSGYQVVVSDSLPVGAAIPDDPTNRDYKQMMGEVNDGLATITPYNTEQGYIDQKKAEHEEAIKAEFSRVNLQDNYVMDLASGYLWEDVINEIVALGSNQAQLIRLNNNFGVARSEIAGVRQMTTVQEVDAYDPYTAPQWDLKP